MRDYQPATIRYHRPTSSALEPSQPNLSTKFNFLGSESLERSV